MDKELHDQYIKLYKELVDRTIQKERMIECMTEYIARYTIKIAPICKNKMCKRPKMDKCIKCIRDYFEERFK